MRWIRRLKRRLGIVDAGDIARDAVSQVHACVLLRFAIEHGDVDPRCFCTALREVFMRRGWNGYLIVFRPEEAKKASFDTAVISWEDGQDVWVAEPDGQNVLPDFRGSFCDWVKHQFGWDAIVVRMEAF